MPADISIVICTYNPDWVVFKRCLDAVNVLHTDNLAVEYIIVDNNSQPAIAGHALMEAFLGNKEHRTIVTETTPGLTHARVTGFEHCTAPVIVFFDDDNEPDQLYIQSVQQFMHDHPEAGVIGPGIIEVEFTEGASATINQFKDVYQQINMEGFKLGADLNTYPSYYPYGTGMVVRKEVLREYAVKVRTGHLATMGRKGKILMGGEDVQIVWLAIQQGYQVGRTSGLSLRHLINKSKSNFSYLKRLAYGGGMSYMPARLEVFPEEKEKLPDTSSVVWSYWKKMLKIIVIHFLRPRRIVLGIAWQLGFISSIYLLKGKDIPALVRLQKKIAGL